MELLREKFELAEDADEDAFIKAFNKTLHADTDDESTPESLTEAEVAKILEEHPAMAGVLDQNKVLSDQNKALVGRVVNLELTGRTQSVSAKLTEWHAGSDERKHGLPTVLDEKMTSFMLSINETQVASFQEIMDEMIKTGFVSLGETKTGKRTRSEASGSVLSDVEDGIKKLMDDNDGMTYADASTQLFTDDEDLYERYMSEQMTDDEEVDA